MISLKHQSSYFLRKNGTRSVSSRREILSIDRLNRRRQFLIFRKASLHTLPTWETFLKRKISDEKRRGEIHSCFGPLLRKVKRRIMRELQLDRGPTLEPKFRILKILNAVLRYNELLERISGGFFSFGSYPTVYPYPRFQFTGVEEPGRFPFPRPEFYIGEKRGHIFYCYAEVMNVSSEKGVNARIRDFAHLHYAFWDQGGRLNIDGIEYRVSFVDQYGSPRWVFSRLTDLEPAGFEIKNGRIIGMRFPRLKQVANDLAAELGVQWP